jgi:hypothetical protein
MFFSSAELKPILLITSSCCFILPEKSLMALDFASNPNLLLISSSPSTGFEVGIMITVPPLRSTLMGTVLLLQFMYVIPSDRSRIKTGMGIGSNIGYPMKEDIINLLGEI